MTALSSRAVIEADPTAGKVPFATYARNWVSNQVWRPSTTVRIETILANHLEPRFGEMAMASITPSHVQTMVKSLSATMAPGSVRGIYSVLAAIFRTAIRDRVVANSPATPDIRLPEVAQRRIVALTLEQVETVADAVGPLYRPLVVLGPAPDFGWAKVSGCRPAGSTSACGSSPSPSRP